MKNVNCLHVNMASVIGKLKYYPAVIRNSCLLRHCNFSTPASAIQEPIPHFKTLENNPTYHTYNHVGKFYSIDKAVKEKLFFSGGIPKRLDAQMDTFRENCIMVREPSLEIMSFLEKIKFSHPAVRFVIYGRHGTGKTTTLMHIVHYAYVSKFLLIHAPWVSNFTKRPKEVVASSYKEGMIDLPVESALWLQHFKLQNQELMKELDLKVSESYTWSKREVTEQGEPLMNVVEHGLQRVMHASDCAAVLLKEIKQQSQSNKFKAMVIVDGVNAFFNKTNVKRPDKTLVPAVEITIANAFLKLLKNDWNNSVIVTSVDIVPFNRDYTMQDPYTPRVLLGKEGFELLDPFIPISTAHYSEKEIESTLDYYVDRLWIQSEKARSDAGRKQLKFLSGYNPFYLMKLCDPL